MSSNPLKCLPLAALVLACHAPVTLAQPAPGAAERLHANAVASFRQARFPEAYGRFISLADAGHAPAAEQALWMYRNGPVLFGSDWDSTQEQLTAWAKLAGQPVSVMTARAYPPAAVQVAARAR